MADAVLVGRVMAHIHNWFEYSSEKVRDCAISGGSLPASVTSRMLDGQWYRIVGSKLNDGVHQAPDNELADETFSGSIVTLAPPREFLAVCDEIADWLDDSDEARRKALRSPYQSESFGGYSYSLKSNGGSNSASGGLTGWQAEFMSSLNEWRKMH